MPGDAQGFLSGVRVGRGTPSLRRAQPVTIIAIKDKEAINPSYLSFSILVKVLNLF